MSRLIFLLVVAVGVCPLASTARSGRAQPLRSANKVARAPAADTPRSLLPEGLYFGMSGGRAGDRAWLLRLNTSTGEGNLYMPPERLKLRFTQSPDGKVHIESAEGFGDLTYTFDGQAEGASLTGRFRFARKGQRDGDDANTFPVTLRRVDDKLQDKNYATSVSGLYSNVEYNEEGSDLTGAELVLLRDQGRLLGILTLHEEEMLPYAVTGVVVSKQQLQFKTRTQSGDEAYRAILSRDKIRLRRTDAAASHETTSMVLSKKKTLREFLNEK
ncbi:MAG TPA: hypothetical protein VF297_08870 [Pyrinomonadaceae bacterium]